MLVPDFANPSCKVATSDGIFVCDDSYATTILRKLVPPWHVLASALISLNRFVYLRVLAYIHEQQNAIMVIFFGTEGDRANYFKFISFLTS